MSSILKALFECFRFFRSEKLKFRKACLSRALSDFPTCAACVRFQICDVNFQIGLKHGNLKNWKSEEISSDFAIRNISIFLAEKHTGTWHRQVSGLSPCMYLRQKRFVVNLCLYVKRSTVYYCSQYGRPYLMELAANCRKKSFFSTQTMEMKS